LLYPEPNTLSLSLNIEIFSIDFVSKPNNFLVMKIEVEQETDGSWIAEVLDLNGVMAYGESKEIAISKAEALALRVIADRIDHGETIPELDQMFSLAS